METKPYRLSCLILCALFFTYTSAQRLTPSPSDSTPANCAFDLRYDIFHSVTVDNPIYYGKSSVSPPYYDIGFADDCNDDACATNDENDLVLQVYYPTGHDYASAPLPVVLFYHASGFSDCFDYYNVFIDSMCRKFARRAFVAINC